MAPVPSESVESSTHPALADPASLARVSAAGLLSWIMPGLGHIFIGDRTRGMVCMVTIVVTFWSGVAIGGVRATVDPQERSLWFLAQLCTGSNVGAAYLLRGNAPRASREVTSAQVAAWSPEDRKRFNELPSREVSSAQVAAWAGPWVSADIGVHYTGVAGLLSILVILDALGRAERASIAVRHPSRDRPGGKP